MAVELTDTLLQGRDETPLQRSDRNLVELLQEVRVVQTGVQVLFGFLLIAPLSSGFEDVGSRERVEYFASLIAAGVAAVLLMAPTAYHRILFRRGDKEHLIAASNRYTLAGLAFVGVAMVGSLLFVSDVLYGGVGAVVTVVAATALMTTCWGLAPLLRRRRLQREEADGPRLDLRRDGAGRSERPD